MTDLNPEEIGFQAYLAEAQATFDEDSWRLQFNSELDLPRVMQVLQNIIVKLVALARRVLGSARVDAEQVKLTQAIIDMANDYVDNKLDLSQHLPAVQRAIRAAAKRDIAANVPDLVDKYLKGA